MKLENKGISLTLEIYSAIFTLQNIMYTCII
jgi:hypothetical protein